MIPLFSNTSENRQTSCSVAPESFLLEPGFVAPLHAWRTSSTTFESANPPVSRLANCCAAPRSKWAKWHTWRQGKSKTVPMSLASSAAKGALLHCKDWNQRYSFTSRILVTCDCWGSESKAQPMSQVELRTWKALRNDSSSMKAHRHSLWKSKASWSSTNRSTVGPSQSATRLSSGLERLMTHPRFDHCQRFDYWMLRAFDIVDDLLRVPRPHSILNPEDDVGIFPIPLRQAPIEVFPNQTQKCQHLMGSTIEGASGSCAILSSRLSFLIPAKPSAWLCKSPFQPPGLKLLWNGVPDLPCQSTLP